MIRHVALFIVINNSIYIYHTNILIFIHQPMNTTYFVLLSVFLTFITGFFVAAIIWGISWFLSPKDEHLFSEWLSGLFSSVSEKAMSTSPLGQGNDSDLKDSEFNQELYNYHHGKN